MGFCHRIFERVWRVLSERIQKLLKLLARGRHTAVATLPRKQRRPRTTPDAEGRTLAAFMEKDEMSGLMYQTHQGVRGPIVGGRA